MRIAIPTANGLLCAHFGHCQQFTVIEIDENNKTIASQESLTPPAHEPGVLPQWLNSLGINLVIAGGMGQRAKMFFEQFNIRVIVGAMSKKPEEIALDYLNNCLECGQNVCDH